MLHFKMALTTVILPTKNIHCCFFSHEDKKENAEQHQACRYSCSKTSVIIIDFI